MIRARVNTDSIQIAFREIARTRNRPLGKVMAQSGRRIAYRCAKYTQPFGFGEGARKQGETAVARDIGRVFASPSQAYAMIEKKSAGAAAGFWKAAQAGNLKDAERIAASVGLDLRGLMEPEKALHKRARNGRGRVTLRQPIAFVMDPQKLRRYSDEVQKRVGLSASGWAAAAKDLGGFRGLSAGDPIARWKRPKRGARTGSGRVLEGAGRGGAPKVVLENSVPWLTTVCPDSTMMRAIREENATVQRELERAYQHELRRAGLKVYR